jgi:hypothetical protein
VIARSRRDRKLLRKFLPSGPDRRPSMRVRRKEGWLCAQSYANRSLPCNSLLTGKTTGNFSKLASLSDFSYAKPHALQRLQCRFPTQNNRENNCRIRENFAQEQGCFRNSGGGKAPAHHLQSPSQNGRRCSRRTDRSRLAVHFGATDVRSGRPIGTVTSQRHFRFNGGTH